MCNDIQKKLDEIRKNSKLHKISGNKVNVIIANVNKGPQMSEILSGRTRSEEFSKKMSERQKGIKKGPQSEKTKERNRQSNLGRIVSDKTKKILSEQANIRMNDPKNKKANSEQAKQRLSTPENNPNYKGLIYSKNIDTSDVRSFNGPKDFVDTEYNYFTVLKRIKSGKVYKNHIWYRK